MVFRGLPTSVGLLGVWLVASQPPVPIPTLLTAPRARAGR